MAIDFNNEVTDRSIVDFDWKKIARTANYNYASIRDAIIYDIQESEYQNQIKFQINDIEMAIPPLHIGINKENLEYSWKTLRSKVSTKVFSNTGIYNVQLTLLFARESLLQLHRLILEIRNNPYVCIKNKYLRSSLKTDDYVSLMKYDLTSLNGQGLKSTHFVVTNLQCNNYQSSPGAFLLELDLRIFNTVPFSSDLKYRHDLFYNIDATTAATINAFFLKNQQNTEDPLTYEDRIIVDRYSNIANMNRTALDLNLNNIYSLSLQDKSASFGVEYPYESCIFVRYYNYLQIKHLYLNFNIEVEDELIQYFSNEKIELKLNKDQNYNNYINNFKGWHDLFNIGLINLESGINSAYRVLSIAGKYFPTKIRNKIIDKMLEDDDTFAIMYESFITMNLNEELLNKIRLYICDDVRFDTYDDQSEIKKYKNKIEANIEKLKTIIINGKDTEVTVTDHRSLSDSSSQKKISLSADELLSLKSYFVASNSGDFLPNYSSLIERRTNVFSNVETVLLAAATTNIDSEIEKLLLLKPLVVTSCSAMLTNSVATIPILGHTYPTYQYLGSHEPVYQLTFAASSFGNDPENIDDLPIGIKTIESFRYEMEHNIQNFKQIPNSQAFSLNCFITKLFDSYRQSDISIMLNNTEGLESNSKDQLAKVRKLVKKRLSINAINTQTLEGSPGTTVGSFRFTETNNFDLEKLQLVYNDTYNNLSGIAQTIYDEVISKCDQKNQKINPSTSKKRLGNARKLFKDFFEYYKKTRSTQTQLIDLSLNPQFNETGEYFSSGNGTLIDVHYSISEQDAGNRISEDDFKQAFSDFLADKGSSENYAPYYKAISAESSLTYYLNLNNYDINNITFGNQPFYDNNGSETQVISDIYLSIETLEEAKINADSYITGELEGKIDDTSNKLIQLLCNFKLLASSLLIEPNYYTEDITAEKERLSKRFYGIFTFKDEANKPQITPIYLSHVRAFIGADPSKMNQKFYQIIDQAKSLKTLSNLGGNFDPNNWKIYNPTNSNNYTGYLESTVLVGGATAVATAAATNFLSIGIFIGALTGGIGGGSLYELNQNSTIRSRLTNASNLNTNYHKLAIMQQFINIEKNSTEYKGFDTPKKENILKEIFAIDYPSEIKDAFFNRIINDAVLFEILYGTSNKDALSDIGASITQKILNTNPIYYLYSQYGIGLENLTNSIVLPDERTTRINSLMFNGFEQIIFSYLYWFPKQTDTFLTIDNLSEDLKYYDEIFVNNTSPNNNISCNNGDRIYLEDSDQLRNLMINYEWSATVQLLQDKDIDNINNYAKSSEPTKPFLSKDKINELFASENKNDYLLQICKKDQNLKKSISAAQDGRLEFLERLFNELILEIARDPNISTSISDNTNIDVSSLQDEVNGLDMLNKSCYPDIDLPWKPLTGKSEKLNPGFFYFDNNTEIFTNEEIENNKRETYKSAEAILKKSYKFMNEMSKGNVYSGNSSWNFIEKKKTTENRKLVTNSDGSIDINSPENQIEITIQDSTITDFREGGILLEMYENDLFNPDNKLPITHPKFNFYTNSEERRLKSGFSEAKKANDGNDNKSVDTSKQSFFQPVIVETGNISILAEQNENLIQQIGSSQLKVDNPTQQTPITDFRPLIGNALLKLNKNRVRDPSTTGLFYSENFNILQGNSTNAIPGDKLDKYEKFIKNSLYADGEASIERVLKELNESLSFTSKRTISKMYPTFKFYIIEEDSFESDDPLVFDDFYNFNAVKDITVYKNRKLVADTAVVRLQNVSGSIDASKPTGIRDIDYEMNAILEKDQDTIGLQKGSLNISSVLLRPGITTQIRLGYDVNPNNLEVMLSGKITDINWSSNGDMCEIVIQSFGTELLAKKIGNDQDGISKSLEFENTNSLLTFMIHQTDLIHFGRYKNNVEITQASDGKREPIRIRKPKLHNDHWIDSVRYVYNEYGVILTIGLVLSIATVTAVSVAFPKVGTSLVSFLNKSGQFLYQSKFVTAISLFTNKFFFRAFGIADDVIEGIGASVVASAANTGVKVSQGRLAMFLQAITPQWLDFLFVKGSLTSFRGFAQKYGYNQALIRLLSNNSAVAKSAVEVIKNKGAMSIFMASLWNTGFKTYIALNVANLALGVTSELIGNSLTLLSSGLSKVLGFGDSGAEMRRKLNFALSEKRIILSPMDDSIYTPSSETYIVGRDVLKQQTSIDLSGDDNYLEKMKQIIKSSSYYVAAEMGNAVMDIFLKNWVFGYFCALSTGLLNYKIRTSPYYIENSVNPDDWTWNIFVNTAEFKQLTENPYAIADKRLQAAFDENGYRIFNKTTWEVFEEMTLRHPGWIAGARPYGLGTEYRVFFGKPTDSVYKRELSEAAKVRLNKIFEMFVDSSNFTVKTNSLSTTTEDELMALLPAKYKRMIKSIRSRLISLLDENSAIESIKKNCAILLLKEYNDVFSNRKEMFRKYHYASSDTNIVSSNISINDKAPNTVNVNYLHTYDSANYGSDYQAKIYTRRMQAHPYIPDENINEISWSETNPDTIQCKGFGAALRYGMALLINGAKEMYDGEIILIGNPKINPHDILLIEDKSNGISGPIEVEAVTHMFSFETGYLTEIKPNALVTGNEAMTYSVTSTAPVFLATEQVVKKFSRRGYLNNKPGEKTSLSKEDSNEIMRILNNYFDIPTKTNQKVALGLNYPNFWYDYVYKGYNDRMFQETANNVQLQNIVSRIKNAVYQNIVKALEEGKIDTLINMKQGLFQLDEQLVNSINLIQQDVINVGAVLAGTAYSVDLLASSLGSTNLLTGGKVASMLGALKNAGKLGAMVSLTALLLGDKIEPIIEEFMQNESTLNNVLNLTQETRFAKINDGTLLHFFPLYKNEKAMAGAGFQYIRQNEIWHNRYGQIYNDLSDAALGYVQMRKQLQSKNSLLSSTDMEKYIKEMNDTPFRKGILFFYNRYLNSEQQVKQELIEKEVVLSNQSASGIIQSGE